MSLYKSILSISDTISDRQISLIAFFISLSISLILFINLDLWNRDGFLYLETAQIFSNSGLSASFRNFHWPFFSILSSYIANFLFITLEEAFYFQSCLFFGLIAYAYSQLSFLLFSKRSEAIIAIIVFFCAVMVNDYRCLIVRDHGAWAFTLLSIGYLVKGIKLFQIKYLFYSLTLLTLSTVFRPESAINMLFFPGIYFYTLLLQQNNIQQNRKQIFFFIFACIVVSLSITSILFMSSLTFSDVSENTKLVLQLFLNIYASNFSQFRELITSAMPELSHRYTTIFIAFGLFGIIIAKIIHVVGYLYNFLFVIYFKNIVQWLKNNKVLSIFYIVLLVPNIVFIFLAQYLDNRYFFCFCLLLLFPVSTAISQALIQNRANWKQILTCSILILSLIDSFYSTQPTKTSYYKDSVEWVKKNLPDDHNILTNDSRLNFLIHGFYRNHLPIEKTHLNTVESNFIIMKLNYEDSNYKKAIISQGWSTLKSFYNNRKDCIIIFSKLATTKVT